MLMQFFDVVGVDIGVDVVDAVGVDIDVDIGVGVGVVDGDVFVVIVVVGVVGDVVDRLARVQAIIGENKN